MKRERIEGLDERVRATLKARKMTFKMLCELTGISKSTMVSSLDTLTMTKDNAIKIADALDVTLDFLLEGVTIKDNISAPLQQCTRFKCLNPKNPSKNQCCYYCKDRELCAEPCLNAPKKCGLFE